MKPVLLYIVLILVAALLAGCEDYYTATLDKGTEMLVVEGRFEVGRSNNQVKIVKTVGFYDDENYPPVDDAQVIIIDYKNQTDALAPLGNGNYEYTKEVIPGRKYKLVIRYENEIYESDYVAAPPKPEIDTVYGENDSEAVLTTNSQGAEEIQVEDGFRLFADVSNPDSARYFRFTSRKILLSTFESQVPSGDEILTIVNFIWRTISPEGVFNIAAPPLYSSDFNIIKHELEFFRVENRDLLIASANEYEYGWIYILYQQQIPKTAYNYYKALNKQLSSEGRLFDPIYSQAAGNVKCVTDKTKRVLGNFEVYSQNESRYFIRYKNPQAGFISRKINTFYNIPENGSIPVFAPPFWEW